MSKIYNLFLLPLKLYEQKNVDYCNSSGISIQYRDLTIPSEILSSVQNISDP